MGAAALILSAETPANAAGGGYNDGTVGVVYEAATEVDGVTYNGQCEHAFAAAGAGSGGATFLEGGAGAAANEPTGSPVVATAVQCALYKDGAWVYTGQNWTPGPASYAHKTWNSSSLNAGTLGIKIYAVLQNGTQVNSGWRYA